MCVQCFGVAQASAVGLIGARAFYVNQGGVSGLLRDRLPASIRDVDFSAPVPGLDRPRPAPIHSGLELEELLSSMAVLTSSG